MNADLNSRIQRKLNKNKKSKNMKRLLLVLSLVAVIVTSTVLANPASALAEDVSDEVVQGLESGGNSGSGAQDPVEAADEQTNAQGNEAAPSSDPQETPAAPSADQGVMNANSVSAVDSAAVTENGTGDGGIAVSGAEADGTEKSADQISAAEGSGTAEQGATLAEAAETVSTEEAAADKTTEKTEQAAQSETDVLSFADDRAQMKIARKDGTGFPSDTTMSGSPLGTDDWNRVLSAVSAKVKAQSDDSTAYSVAGLHTWKLSLQAGDGSAASYDDIRAEAEFQGGLNDAGYATKTSEKEESGTDGTSTTTASYETSWRVYAISGDSIADPVEDHLTDLTDADGTSLSVDENGALQSAAFDGSLPETVVFAQIVRETVTTGTEKKKEIPMPAVTFDKEATTDHGTITVHVEADEGTFEQGTTMSVKRVSSQDILDKAIEAAGGRGSAAAVDISFRKADGTETEPAKPIRVKMTAKVLGQADQAHVVHVDDNGSTVVVAKKSDGKTIESTSSEAASSDAKNAVSFESDSFSVYAIVYTVDFEYSVNGKMYQFSLPGGEKIALSDVVEVLGILDGTNFEDAEAFLAEVADVEFSDESLVKVVHPAEDTTVGEVVRSLGVEHQLSATLGKEEAQNIEAEPLRRDEWALISIKPFDSEETLTISMKDSTEYVIRVTDEQHVVSNVAELLTDVKIDATVGPDGKYVVYEGQPYDIHLTFKENPNGGQLNMTDGFYYPLPDGLFDTIATSGTAKIKLSGGTHAGEEVELNYTVENGQLKFTWPDQSSGAYNQLKDALYTGFTVNIEAQFKEGRESLQFSDTITKELDVKTDGYANVSKSGTYNPKTNCVDYTVTVTSHGICTNVAVHDDISGTALTYNGDATAKSNVYGKEVPTPTTSGNGFNLTIPQMGDNETVTITYSAAVDLTKITAENGVLGTVTQTKNRVTATPDNHPGDEDEKSGKDFNNKISFSTISKSGSAGETSEDGHSTVTWTIKANENANVSMAGHTISDMIDSNSQDIMSYSGGYITVIRRDANGNIVGNADGEKIYLDMSGNSWTWTVPNSSPDTGKLSYEIIYTTDVDVSEKLFNTQVKNTATSDNGGSSSAHADVTPPGGAITARKSVVSRDLSNQIITWEVSFDVPATGLDSARIDDILPNVWDNSGNLIAIDDYIDSTVTIVPALEAGEGYNTSTYTGTDQKKHLVIDFYKIVDGQEEDGLIGTGSKRKIRVQFQTEISEDWLEAAAGDPDNNNYKTHQNNANVILNGQTLGTSASTKIEMSEPGMSKLLDSKSIQYINGVGDMPAFEYTVLLTGLSEDSFDENGQIILEDTYNGKYLKYFNNSQYRSGDVTRKNGFLYGSTVTVVDNGATSQGPYVVDEAGSTDGKLRFVLNYADFTVDNGMLDADGAFKPYYFVHYYLAVKDAVALEKLIHAAAQSDEGKVELNNTVRNDFFGEESHTVDYEVPVIDKQVGNTEYRNGNYIAHYKIIVNKNALQLGDEEELVLKDEYENISVDYTTVKIYEGASYTDNNKVEASDVSWDRKGHTMTYYLKNSHYYIIEYDAKITGTPDDHNKVIYTNTAEVFGVKDTETHEQTFSSGGGGESVTWGIQIFKHKKGAASTPLDATFDLYMYQPTADQPDGYKTRPEDNKGVEKDGWVKVGTLTTGADGIAHTADIDNGNFSIHSQTWYALWETSEPAGYEKKDFSYVFWVTEGSTPDYSKYVYVNDDVVAIDNSPTIPETVDVNVVKKWIEEDDEVIEHAPVTVHLYADGDPIEDHVNDEGVKDIVRTDGTIQLGENSDWNYTWRGLPGGPVYSVVEDHVTEYTTTYSPRNTQGLAGNNTLTITNKKIPNKTAIKVEKEWGAGTEKPEDITIQLKRYVSANAEIRVVRNNGEMIKHFPVPVGADVQIMFAGTPATEYQKQVSWDPVEEFVTAWQGGAHPDWALYKGNSTDASALINNEGWVRNIDTQYGHIVTISYENIEEDGLTLKLPSDNASYLGSGVYDPNLGLSVTPAVTFSGGGSGEGAEDVFYTGEHHYYTLNEENGWSLVIDRLPLSDDDGSYTYYVEEIGVNDNTETPQESGYEVSYTNNDGITEGTIKVKNDKESLGKIQVTKFFSGVDNLPEGFHIVNDFNDEIFNVSNAEGEGTAASPYTWLLDDVPPGTEVEFTEMGATVNGYALTITTNGTAHPEGSTTAMASETAAKVAAGDPIPTVAFVNEYEQHEEKVGDLQIKKTTTVNDDTDTAGLINGTYEFTLTGSGDAAGKTATVEITVAGGKATGASLKTGAPDGTTVETNTETGIVTVKDLPVGTYTVTEDESKNPSGVVLKGSNNIEATVSAEENAEVPLAEFVNNKQQSTSLKIIKVDAHGMTTLLEGAKFEIRKVDPDNVTLSYLDSTATLPTTNGTDHKTGTDGEATFTGLTAGIYEVREAEMPAGYVQTGDGVFYIKVENGTVSLVTRTVTEDGDGAKHVSWSVNSGDAKLMFTAAVGEVPATAKVGNDAGVALPSTGGHGTLPLTGAGALLLLLAGTALTVRKLLIQRNTGKGGGSE